MRKQHQDGHGMRLQVERAERLLVQSQDDFKNDAYEKYLVHLDEHNELVQSLYFWDRYMDFWSIPDLQDAYAIPPELRAKMQKEKLGEIVLKTRLLLTALRESTAAPNSESIRVRDGSRSQPVSKDSSANSQTLPKWFPAAGFCCALLTLLFAMLLVLANMLGHYAFSENVVLNFVLAFGSALSVVFLGGEAKASGRIPIFANQNPLVFSVSGGIAVFVIVLVLLHYLAKP